MSDRSSSRSIGARLARPMSYPAAHFVAIVIGACVLMISLPWDFLNGTSGYWVSGGADSLAAMVGLRYFLAEPWSWPLLHIGALAGGTTAAYTDSIPILAIALKALGIVQASPYGFWVALCYVIVPVAAVRVSWEAGCKCGIALVLIALLAVTFPIFQLRIVHVSLEAQFVPLIALELYLRRRAGRAWRWAEAVLPPLAVSIHPYLAAMSLAFPLASFGEALLLGGRRSLSSRLQLAFSAAWPSAAGLAGCVALIIIYGVSVPVPHEAREWGRFSLNLLAPLWPMHSFFLGPLPGPMDFTDGQFDEQGWIGLGAILLLLLSFPTLRRGVKSHRALAMTCLLCVGFAVTTRVWFGSTQLLDYYPERLAPLLEVFRSSGRFVWIPLWTLLLGSAAAAGRRGGWSLVMLATVSILQFADTIPVRTYTDAAARFVRPPTFDWDVARPLMVSAQKVEIHPTHLCTLHGAGRVTLQLHALAAETLRPINSARLARDATDCAAEARDAMVGGPQPSVLQVFVAVPDEPVSLVFPEWTMGCTELALRPSGFIRFCGPK